MERVIDASRRRLRELRTGLTDPEVAAVYAEGGRVAMAFGLQRPVETEPSHRLTDLPPGAIARVLNIPVPEERQ